MTAAGNAATLEEQIGQWRGYLRRRQAIRSSDVVELEDHLRAEIATLGDAGLDADEAFLVAVKRMGSLDTLSREFAVEHADRLWKQLVVPAEVAGARRLPVEAAVAVALGAGAAAAVKAPALFGMDLDHDAPFYARNLAVLVLPFLASYFAWRRQLGRVAIALLAMVFALGAFGANIFPFADESATGALTALHLPIALWLAVGTAYAGARWKQTAGRMDFIRFTGEFAIYFALIALGGGVLTGFTALTFEAIGVDPEGFTAYWMLPCGAAGAVLVAAWLVEAKQSVIENMAPVLTRLFTPLFAAMLLAFLGALVWNGRGVDIERDALVGFDLLLVVVLGLLLYSISARDPLAPPDFFDILSVVLVGSALVADAVALWALAERVEDFGFSANRTAGLGANLILLVNLAWSAVLYVRFLRGRGRFAALERWQTSYVPVYAAWAAVVVVVFPLVFGYD